MAGFVRRHRESLRMGDCFAMKLHAAIKSNYFITRLYWEYYVLIICYLHNIFTTTYIELSNRGIKDLGVTVN